MVGPALGSPARTARPFRLASRGSSLARRQAEQVAGLLRAAHPGLEVELVLVRTTGDRITDLPLARIGDRGLFTKEVDDAVLRGDAEAAVHSLKDLPTLLQEGLALGAIPERDDPRDVLVFRDEDARGMRDLPPDARVGTSSLRRRAQLLAARSDVSAPDIRGNVETRLRALDDGRYDALILAAAGLRRLGLEGRIGAHLQPPEWLPAAGQGALAVTCAAGSRRALSMLASLTHAETARATAAERAFLRRLQGGCQVPVGALARVSPGLLRLEGLIASLDGDRIVRGSAHGAPADADEVGEELAERLLAEGGAEILRAVRAVGTPAGTGLG
ncbi:MAG TPA: hydroxymethylbilane synthase [Longimicrobiales bacterium]|nr:hydroxymethylbilane synthase [Longimicrobiales bacterium]